MTLFILCVGKVVDGDIAWDVSPLPAEDEPTDAELQRIIDEGEQTAEYMDYLEDVDFWRHGSW